jgi:hypothetical protein
MINLEINVNPPLPYRQRMRKHLGIPLLLTAIFAIMIVGFRVMIKNDFIKFIWPVADILFFFGAVYIQYKWAIKEETYYITHLKLSPDDVEIIYTDKDEPYTAIGKPGEYSFYKKEALARTGSTYQQSYLEIYYKDKMLLRQYSSEDWTDLKFIEVVHAAKNG